MDSRLPNSNRQVTEDMLQHLPAPAQRYLRWTGVVGKPWINTVRIQYAGKFRRAADQPWMPIRATQVYTINPPAFLWKARLSMFGLPLMRGQDTYKAGHGHMFGRLAGLFTLFDACGDEMDQGAMLRYLNEMMWFPTALLGDNIAWQEMDDESAGVTFTDQGRRVTATLMIDGAGRLVNFVTRRYRENKGGFTLDIWETPMLEHGMLAGLNMPIRGQAVWKLPNGDLPYADLKLTEVQYNLPIEPI
jgi:hypothetical protein